MVVPAPPPTRSSQGSRTSWVFAICLAAGFCIGCLFTEKMEVSVLTVLPSTRVNLKTISTGSSSSSGRSSHHREPVALPTFDEGGVVLFFHVAKTGGTSIRTIFSDKNLHPNVYLETAYNGTAFLQQGALIDRILTKNTTVPIGKNVLFLETHGLSAPALPFLHPFIQKWKAMATEHNTSFFAFTLVRDPVSYAVSYFNFFNADPCTLPFCPWRLYNPTEGNLVQTTEANNQCLLMARDHWGIFFLDNRTAPSERECNLVYDTLLQDMDWIGTTEKMSSETIPLLTYMLTHNMTRANTALPAFNVMNATKNQSVILHKSALSEFTVDYIRSLSYLDQEMHNRAERDFYLGMYLEVGGEGRHRSRRRSLRKRLTRP